MKVWFTSILLFYTFYMTDCKQQQANIVVDNKQLSEDALDYILKNTGAKKPDVIGYYQGFVKDFPSGVLNKKDFKKFMKGYNQVSDDRMDEFIKNAFNVYDTNNDGIIDFKEFYSKLWVESFGSLQQKSDLAFKFFDINQHSYIDKSDVKQVLTSLSNANEPFGKKRGSEYKQRMANIDFNTEKIVEFSDANKDKKVTFDEFKNAVATQDFVRSRTVDALF